MNAFAEMLLSSLLGWLRGLTQGLWRFFSDGGAGGFLSWIGDHWLVLTLALCAAGVLIDLVVWLFRWRPDIAWRRKARTVLGKLNGREMRAGETWRFNHGYEDSIEMLKEDIPEEEPAPEENEEMVERRFFDYGEEEFYAVEPDSAYQSADTAYRRKRRTDRYDTKPKGRLFRKVNAIIGATADDQDMIDGLPTVIDKNQAFHNPVYPRQKG